MEGSKTLICREDGTWDGPYSKCVAKPCPDPIIPSNGNLKETRDTWRVGDKIQYTCDEGFKVEGSASIECIDNGDIEGEWEHPPPSCSVVICPSLPNIRNGAHTITFQPESPHAGAPSKMLVFPQGELSVSFRKKRSPDDFPSIGFGQSSGFDYYGQKSGADYFNGQSDFDEFGQQSGGQLSSDYDFGGQLSGGQSVSDYDFGGQLSGGQSSSDYNFGGQLSGGQSSVDYNFGGQQSGGFDYISQSSGGLTFGGQQSSSDYEDFGLGSQNLVEITYYHGSEVEYSCRPGYKIVGSKTRKCVGEGVWDNPEPRCYEQYCPALSSLENGHMIYHGSGVDSKVEFTCHDGFYLEGDSEILCQPTRTWLGTFPSCELIDCGAAPTLVNGSLSVEATTFGSVATYDCYVGFVLEGSFERFCVGNGFWNGSAPRCIEVTCKVPPVIDNGYITFEGSLYVDSPIEYECKECFKLNGTRFRQCQIDGTWNLVEPTCDLIYCDSLPNELPNGKIIGADNSCGSLVEFECNPGYEMKGRGRATCLESQRWSSPVPTCERVSCGTLPSLKHGTVIGDSFTFTDKVTYECNEGFVLRGTNVRVCQEDASWSDSSPYCDIKNCTKPKGPSNGRVRLSGLFYGSTANIVCDPGFRLDGDRNLNCNAEGVWDKEMPYCWPVICPPAPLIDNGSYNSSERQFESFTTLIYECDVGFYTESTETSLLCSADGEWQGKIITCLPKDCGHPGDLANGHVAGENFTYGASVGFSCDEGYNLLGTASAECLDTGEWSHQGSSCEQIVCPDPMFIPFARLVADDSQTVFGTNVHYECEKGYLLSGSANLTCDQSGQWTASPPSCDPVRCPTPLEDLNSVRTGSVFEYGRMISYACNEGYSMKGHPLLTCLEDGRWSQEFPICEMITCPPPEDIQFGSYESLNISNTPIKTEPYQLAQLHSKTKTRKSGRLVSLLQESQLREGVLYKFGDSIEYECDEGHSMTSESILTCTESGWSGETPSCRAITCPIPISIRNGDILGDDVVFGSVIEYTCDEGYELIGDRTRTCQADKEWSDTEPYCRIIECQRPASLEHGQTIGMSIKYKSILSYVCDAGYRLEGVGTR